MTNKRRRKNSPLVGTRVITNIAAAFDSTEWAKNGAFAATYDLVTNNTGGPTGNVSETLFSVGQKYRVSNIVFNGQIEANYNNNLENMTIWIVKVPEGYTFVTDLASPTAARRWNFPYRHPEWVLGWKFVGNPVVPANDSIHAITQIPVRANRSTILNPGDKLVALVTGNGQFNDANNYQLLATGIIDYKLTIM